MLPCTWMSNCVLRLPDSDFCFHSSHCAILFTLKTLENVMGHIHGFKHTNLIFTVVLIVKIKNMHK